MHEIDVYEDNDLIVTLEFDNNSDNTYSSYIPPSYDPMHDEPFDPEFYKDELNALKTPYYENMLLGLHNA